MIKPIPFKSESIITFVLLLATSLCKAQVDFSNVKEGEIYSIKIGDNSFQSYEVNEVLDSLLTITSEKTKSRLEIPYHLISKIIKTYERKPSIGLRPISTFDIVSHESGDAFSNRILFIDKVEFRYPIGNNYDVSGSFIYSGQDFSNSEFWSYRSVDNSIWGFEVGAGIFGQVMNNVLIGLRAGMRMTHSQITSTYLSDVNPFVQTYKANFLGFYSNLNLEYRLSDRWTVLVSSDLISGTVRRKDAHEGEFSTSFNKTAWQPFGQLVIYHSL